MGIPPNFNRWVQHVPSSFERKDAEVILQHSWSQLSKGQKKMLAPLMEMIDTMNKSDQSSKARFQELSHKLKSSPELKETLDLFYKTVKTEKKPRDDFHKARAVGADVLKQAVHSLGMKGLDIKGS